MCRSTFLGGGGNGTKIFCAGGRARLRIMDCARFCAAQLATTIRPLYSTPRGFSRIECQLQEVFPMEFGLGFVCFYSSTILALVCCAAAAISLSSLAGHLHRQLPPAIAPVPRCHRHAATATAAVNAALLPSCHCRRQAGRRPRAAAAVAAAQSPSCRRCCRRRRCLFFHRHPHRCFRCRCRRRF